jgi:NADH:ubiquinone oxidoreductase subunit D
MLDSKLYAIGCGVSYLRPGRVAQDMPLGLSENIFLFTQQALDWGFSGVMLRGLGVC